MLNQIETTIGEYIRDTYSSAVEVGFGGKTIAAKIIQNAKIPILCTDVHQYTSDVISVVDDCVYPDYSLYKGTAVIYAIRPGIEMIPALINLAQIINTDLIIYHLGFEIYLNGGERIETNGIILHQYVRALKPSNI